MIGDPPPEYYDPPEPPRETQMWSGEPWKISEFASAALDIDAVIESNGMVFGHKRDKIRTGTVCISGCRKGRHDEDVNADFIRIVACVNAMAGVDGPVTYLAALRESHERLRNLLENDDTFNPVWCAKVKAALAAIPREHK